MSCWGPGILESDAAQDALQELSHHVGFDVNSSTPSQVSVRRVALEQHLSTLVTETLYPSALEDLSVAEKLVRCLLAYETRLSPAARVALTRAAQNLAHGNSSPETMAAVPDFDRATACQTLVIVLMRYGCEVPAREQAFLLDAMLSCDVHALALDEDNAYFPEDLSVPLQMRTNQRMLGTGRIRSLHALHLQFKNYPRAGGQPQDLAA